MDNKLKDKRIAFLATNGVEEYELERPWKEMKKQGAENVLVSIQDGEIQSYIKDKKSKCFEVDKTIGEVDASEFDGLVLPGGVVSPDMLRQNNDAVQFVRDFFKQKKPIAAICHGPVMLIEADVLDGIEVTSYPSIRTDIENAGGCWLDEEVVVDDGITTSRSPDDLGAFCDKAIEEFCEGKHKKRSNFAA